MNGVAAYAGSVTNPLMLLAMESTRQHLAKFPYSASLDLQALGEHLVFKPAYIDQPALLKHWQQDSRESVLRFEAMEGLAWEPLAEVEGGRFVFVSKGTTHVLIRLSRPTLLSVLQKQAERVAKRAGERVQPKSDDLSKRERISEISVQVVPQFAFWNSVLPMHPERMPRTLELLQVTLELAYTVAQRFKHALAVPRPHEVDLTVRPALLTPAHGSFPSGHASEAFAAATVLSLLIGANDGTKKTLLALAQRIADNREVAGLHYAIDSMAGQVLGTVVGDYLVARCQGGVVTPRSVDGSKFEGDEACDPSGLLPDNDDVFGSGAVAGVDISPELQWLWTQARTEWGYSVAPASTTPKKKRRE